MSFRIDNENIAEGWQYKNEIHKSNNYSIERIV